MAGNSNESTVAEERGREATPTNKNKKRDQSKAHESASLELMVAEFGERLERVQHNFKTLEDHVLEQVDTLKGNAEETNNEVEARFIQLEDMIQAVREGIEGMREDLTLCKRATVSKVANNVSTPRVKCPKPKHADIERGACRLDTWDEFNKELKKHFYPDNVVYEARKKLRELKQRGIMWDYVKEFTTLMLQIPNMSEEDLLFNFIDGLQGWAKQEMHRRDIIMVDEAIAIAKSLVDFQPYSHTNAAKNKDKYPTRGGGERRENNQGNRDQDHRRPQAKEGDRDQRLGRRDYEEKKKAFVPKGGCFLCKGPHPMSSCPKLGSLSAIVDRQDTESQAEMGSLQVLNALKAKSLTPTLSNGLMYMEAVINEKPTRAMVDTGSTHNFVSKDEANRLGLKYIGSTGWLKTVNTQAVPLNGVTRGVELRLGTWKGQVNFSVVPMDDFKVILGLDFLRQVTAFPMSSFSSVCILEKGCPCMIPTVEASKEKGRDATQLSAIQLGKGIKKGDITYLAMLKEDNEIEKTDDLPPIIREVLEENKDVMPPELPNKLPPRREVDHKIELEPGTKPPALAPYRMAPPELEELRRELKELVDMGIIRHSKAPYGEPVLFQKKHDGSLRMCVDYRALNKVTIKNHYPIPLITNLFDRLGGAKVYTKMDFQKGYYQVRIAEGDEPKTTCITRYRSYEWLVMPFGLTNAPATFCMLMNKLFQPYLDQFMVVYLDDIVVYSNSMEEHIDHLRIVFKILRENELYVKKKKCTFATEEVHFLGHVIGHGKLLMDRNKIKAITEWEPQTKVSEMRSFLGLVNYYRRFIQGYSARASPLTDLLKKGKTWEWSKQCQKAFEDLKAAVSQEPVLALPNFTMPFEVHTDVSNFAIGGVLMQEGHPIAFESRKLNDTERRYTMQEKEMTTIIHCLWVWRHYLLSAHFTIKTDNVATSYFQTQKKLSPKQARWQDFLAEFDYTLEYKLGKANVVADALSRKTELAAISLAKGTVLEHIKEGLEQDPLTRELVKLASDGKTQRFWVEDGLLYTKGRRIYVPKWDNLRQDLIKECHDTKWAGHPGQKRTMALLETTYFWPHMKDSVELYVKTCLAYQQDKVENRQPAGLLEPLPVPQRPWDSITLDSISVLPKSEGYGSIMVVVDRFSKYGTFIPCPKDCTAEEAARAFFKNVVKHWGLPRSIISDRDPQFTGRQWTELFKLLGTKLNFSTFFHPQTDGQTEWVNALLECYLRHFVSANQRDWAKLLDVAQFSYNLQRSEATCRSAFELATGQQPLTPHTLTMPLDEGKSPRAANMAKSWEEIAEIARACLEKARKKMKKWADEKRQHREFSVRDLVLVKLLPQQFKAL
ncbi:cytochrome P450 78A7-like [Hibiscus syriacus]|uniref:Cytochrome P450 78A7-like n=1 Tax=Hibiscus syriacus TaxID=106335 RepID=A0A6A3CLN4_HIBSY|nr:cytochrome P450 78A7-like [Hibiscus syriacus]